MKEEGVQLCQYKVQQQGYHKKQCSFISIVILSSTARKAIFSFPRRPEKMVFSKGSSWNMIFLIFSRKMIFLFTPWTENERWSFLKNTWKYDIFFRLLKRWYFQKGSCRHIIFLVLSGKMVFFPENMICFHRAESERRPFPGRKAGNLIYRIEAWLLLKFIWLGIFYNE